MNPKSFLANRFERKYLISERRAEAVRNCLLPHVQADAYLTPDLLRGYPVYSLYLDSPDLALYQAAAQGMKNRFKLRLRYYDEEPDSPLFCEIKRRLDQVVRKQRVGVRKQALMDVLAGRPVPDDLLLKPGEGRRDLDEFLRLTRALSARPTLIVGYNRQAYLDLRSGNSRITFDRDLCAAAFRPSRGLTTRLSPVRTRQGRVILEIKYTDRLPAWIQDMIRRFELERQSIPKYGWSVEEFGEPDVARQAGRINPQTLAR